MFETEFGFLPEPRRARTAEVLVEPLSDFETTKQSVLASLHPSGFLYPPQEQTVRVRRTLEGEVDELVPNSKRPAHLYYLEATHRLTIFQPVAADVLNGDASFLVHLFSYLWGHRLQIDDWQVDGRIPIKTPTHHVLVGQPAAERFIASAYNVWRSATPEMRIRLSTLLYLHSKAPSYEWTWEEFLIQYVVTDALFGICRDGGMFKKKIGHADQIRAMADQLCVWCPPEAPVAAIVSMRNNLFHQGIWAGERPGYKLSSEEWDRTHELQALNQRLLAAYFGGSTGYTHNPWIHWRDKVEFV